MARFNSLQEQARRDMGLPNLQRLTTDAGLNMPPGGLGDMQVPRRFRQRDEFLRPDEGGDIDDFIHPTEGYGGGNMPPGGLEPLPEAVAGDARWDPNRFDGEGGSRDYGDPMDYSAQIKQNRRARKLGIDPRTLKPKAPKPVGGNRVAGIGADEFGGLSSEIAGGPALDPGIMGQQYPYDIGGAGGELPGDFGGLVNKYRLSQPIPGHFGGPRPPVSQQDLERQDAMRPDLPAYHSDPYTYQPPPHLPMTTPPAPSTMPLPPDANLPGLPGFDPSPVNLIDPEAGQAIWSDPSLMEEAGRDVGDFGPFGPFVTPGPRPKGKRRDLGDPRQRGPDLNPYPAGSNPRPRARQGAASPIGADPAMIASSPPLNTLAVNSGAMAPRPPRLRAGSWQGMV